MDVTEIRRDFPILNQEGKPLVYLDNGATTQKPQAVIDRLCRYYSMENSNIHRGSYPLSSQASRMYERARETVRSWVDAEYGEKSYLPKDVRSQSIWLPRLYLRHMSAREIM